MITKKSLDLNKGHLAPQQDPCKRGSTRQRGSVSGLWWQPSVNLTMFHIIMIIIIATLAKTDHVPYYYDHHHCPTHQWCHLCRCRRDCRYTRPPSPPQDLWVMRRHLKRSRSTSILTVSLFFVIESNFQSHISPNQVLNMFSLSFSDWFLKEEVQSTMAITGWLVLAWMNTGCIWSLVGTK